jgi:transcriptional regulator with XRE-family HTH domain
LRLYGITLNDLAHEMGFDRTYLSKAIHGQIRPSVKFLTRLAQTIETFGRNRRIDSSMFLRVCDTHDDSAGSDQDEPPALPGAPVEPPG